MTLPHINSEKILDGLLTDAIRGKDVDLERLAEFVNIANQDPHRKVVFDAVLDEGVAHGTVDTHRVFARVQASGNGEVAEAINFLVGLLDAPPEPSSETPESFKTPPEGARIPTRTTAEGRVPIHTVCAADIESKPIDWLWEDRLALGKLTLLASDPGMGKSILSSNIAATVSIGGEWPVGEGKCERGMVIIASFEDDHDDTTKPRLEAAGADCTMIRFLGKVPDNQGPRYFDLKRDVPRLEELLELYPETKLVILDPISAAMGDTDCHKNTQVRAALHPLVEMAQRRKVAILGISHFTKDQGKKALHRVIDSVAFTATSRIVFTVAEDHEQPEDESRGKRYLLLPIKSNIGRTDNTLSFYNTKVILSSGIEARQIEWGGRVHTTADEALAPEEERGKLEVAKDFLREILASGPMLSEEIDQRARKAKISATTLKRAKKKLMIQSKKDHFCDKWTWKLPE